MRNRKIWLTKLEDIDDVKSIKIAFLNFL